MFLLRIHTWISSPAGNVTPDLAAAVGCAVQFSTAVIAWGALWRGRPSGRPPAALTAGSVLTHLRGRLRCACAGVPPPRFRPPCPAVPVSAEADALVGTARCCVSLSSCTWHVTLARPDILHACGWRRRGCVARLEVFAGTAGACTGQRGSGACGSVTSHWTWPHRAPCGLGSAPRINSAELQRRKSHVGVVWVVQLELCGPAGGSAWTPEVSHRTQADLASGARWRRKATRGGTRPACTFHVHLHP